MSDETSVLTPPPPATAPPPLDEETQLDAVDDEEVAAPLRPEMPPPVLTVVLAAASSAAAAGWMVAGLFRGVLPHLVTLLGVAVGAGCVALGHRGRLGSFVQYLALPLAVVAGAVLVAPDATNGATLFSLVGDALHSAGLLQPPIPFDPGWRFILVVLFAVLTAGAASLALATNRPRLGVLLPVPLTAAAALIQPPSAEISSAVVALLFVMGALGLAYGAELRGQGQLTGAFEMRRMGRAGAAAAALSVLLVALNSLGALFPPSNHDQTIPPQKPPTPPAQPDQVLFSARYSEAVPLVLGVIDTYDPAQKAWLLPPYDPARLQTVPGDGTIPGAHPSGNDVKVQITVGTLGGHALPSLAGATRVQGAGGTVTYDPRTGALGVPDAPLHSGMTYTVDAAPTPSGRDLGTAPPPPASMTDFLTAPPMPQPVRELLATFTQRALQAHAPDDAFDRLQYLRQQLYTNVVAAGPGVPVDVDANRVAQMLQGGSASPYEITAAEALLARWAGVPSRIGFGYYGGDKQADGSYAMHPKHGATFLEVWFSGHGWLPVVGTPPRARPSTRTGQRNDRNNITASDDLDLVVYVPVQFPDVTQLYEYVRYWAAVGLPIAAAIALVLMGYPWLLKLERTRRRRAWARRHGVTGRIAVAYAQFRDAARDLAVGVPSDTPVEFLQHLQDDVEHEELAWLTTRALWGDLRRDLRDDDAAAAERLSRSVRGRMLAAQTLPNRALAAAARTSLRDPYSDELPNVWFEVDVLGWSRRARRSLRDELRRVRRTSRRLAFAGATVVLVVALAACGAATIVSSRPLPQDLVPATMGPLHFDVEKAAAVDFRNRPGSLVSSGEVFTVQHDSYIEGSVQVSVFKPSVDTSDLTDAKADYCLDNPDSCTGHEVFAGIQQSFGGGHFQRVYWHGERAYTQRLSDQYVYVWFPPGTNTVAMLILRSQFSAASSDALFHALLDYENHRTATPVPIPAQEG